ncbi:MAG: methyl-accepting chemotaxis protein [Synergistaceae bacterium]|jgi:methyl-accepting chemotaxis protein|nr:methyl-accepting chemotaxis protein [Synergistaceae bacterium]
MSLRYKLTFSIAAILVGVMMFAVVFQIYEIRANYEQNSDYTRRALFEVQKESMKNITIAFSSLFDYFDKQVRDGNLSLEEAQRQAREQIRVVRYDTGNKALQGGNYFWIDETNGNNVLHPITPQIEGKNRIKALDANNMEMIRALIESGMRGGDFTEFFYEKPGETSGKQKIGYSIEYKPWKWVIGTGFWTEDWNAAIDAQMANWQKEAVAFINRLIVYTLIGFLVLLAVVLFLTFVYTKRFVKPILELNALSAEVAQGNFAVEIEEDSRRDEIGTLRKSMKDMAENLAGLLTQLNESAEELFETSGVLLENSEQSARSAREVAGSAEGIADDAQAQMNAVENMARAIGEIGGGIEDVASGSARISEKSVQTSAMAEEGSESLSGAITQMHHISDTTKKTAEAVKNLGDKFKKINEIVELISGVSAQTNLLALNAAIEAARAGEQGRGFAVVAEEVRKLAEQSRQATGKITQEILELQQDADNTVELMSVGVGESEKGVAVVTQNSEMLEKIIADIRELDQEIRKITSVAKELSDSKRTVQDAAEKLGGICSKTLDAAKGIACVTQNQSASVEKIEDFSKNLSAIANDMQSQVAKFAL